MYILGAYVPLTLDGNLVVDKILASCYAQIDHDLAHTVMKPIQWYPKILEWITGDDDGFPIYVTTAKVVSKWLLSNDIP